jgi:hypothetical protein
MIELPEPPAWLLIVELLILGALLWYANSIAPMTFFGGRFR